MNPRATAMVGLLIAASACAGSPSPPAATVTRSVVKQVSAGWSHALALKSDGTVWAWGANDSFQLGKAERTDSLVPIQVKALGNHVIAVAAAASSSYALKADGSVWAWGENDRGQLGDGTVEAKFTPVRVAGLGGRVTAIAAGDSYVLALKSDGTVWAWGDDYASQLGDGDGADKLAPEPVTGLSQKVIGIAAGKSQSLAVTADGSVWFWGDYDHKTPTRMQGLPANIVGVGANMDQGAAIDSDGGVWTWGRVFLPSGQYMGTEAPAQVPQLTHVTQLGGGWDFFVALESNGSVLSWGENLDTLGDGTPGDSPTDPVHVVGLDTGVVAIGVGSSNGYAITSAGKLWAWGNNNHGELGNGTIDPQGGTNVPVEVGSF